MKSTKHSLHRCCARCGHGNLMTTGRERLGRASALGSIDPAKINVKAGSVAIAIRLRPPAAHPGCTRQAAAGQQHGGRGLISVCTAEAWASARSWSVHEPRARELRLWLDLGTDRRLLARCARGWLPAYLGHHRHGSDGKIVASMMSTPRRSSACAISKRYWCVPAHTGASGAHAHICPEYRRLEQVGPRTMASVLARSGHHQHGGSLTSDRADMLIEIEADAYLGD